MSAKHPLSTTFSADELDRLLNSIAFSVFPRQYRFTSAQLPEQSHVVNYSLLYESLPDAHRPKFVSPLELKNGDILKFSDYRECGTFYCLWLAKNLFPQDLQRFLKSLESGGGADGKTSADSATPFSFSSLPIDLQVSFMPKPVVMEATMDSYPHRFPRDDPRVGSEGGDFHLYAFCHLDEYGFGGTTATSMASEKYFQAVKIESPSFVLLDPLLIHSQSYYGQLLHYMKEQRPEHQLNPCFPHDYILRIYRVQPATWNAETHTYDTDELAQHANAVTLLPIDLADEAIINSGCTSSTVTADVLQTLTQMAEEDPDLFDGMPTQPLNLLYEIRNLFYQHFLVVSGRSSSTFHATERQQSPLPLYNEVYLRYPDRVRHFFIAHTATIEWKPPHEPFVPRYYVPQPFNVYSQQVQSRLEKEIKAEMAAEAAEWTKDSSATGSDTSAAPVASISTEIKEHIAMQSRLQKRISECWAALTEADKQDVQAIVDAYQAEAQIVQRDFAVYALYRRTQRVPLLTTWVAAHPEGGSWFDSEVFAVDTWMALEDAAKEPFRRLQDEDDRLRQLMVDAQTIQQTLALHTTMARTDAMRNRMNPVAAAASLLATSLTAMHNPEQLPPPPPQEEEPPAVVVPPSRFNFRSIKNSGSSGGFGAGFGGGASARRPPVGFIAFVVDTFPVLNTPEMKRQGVDVYEELIRRWETIAGDAEAVAAIVAREEELERVGQEQEAIRTKERQERQAQMRQQGGGFGGFGGASAGFGGFGFGGAGGAGVGGGGGARFGAPPAAPTFGSFGAAAAPVATAPSVAVVTAADESSASDPSATVAGHASTTS